MKNISKKTVAEIVTGNFERSRVFDCFGIDYYCHGDKTLAEACKEHGDKIVAVETALDEIPSASAAVDFKDWPLDLLCDYVLKVFHRGIRKDGPEVLARLDKACEEYGRLHPSLYEIKELFMVSLQDLYHHLDKEEHVLFPYIYSLCDAERDDMPAPRFHCGSIASPIEVMRFEHATEGERYVEIENLTGGYMPPEDVNENYVELMRELKEFTRNIQHHIHLENNLIFPRALELEKKLAARETVAQE